MKTTLARRAMTSVIASAFFIMFYSCVNPEYELSEENISTDVQIFQDGLSFPLGKTTPVTLGSLLSKLDPETKEMFEKYLSTEDGKYGISYSGDIDLSDTLNNISKKLKIDAIKIDEKFSLPLSEVNLDGVRFDEQNIPTQTVDIAAMVNVPEIKLPEISQSMDITATVPSPDTKNLNLDFGSLNMKDTIRFASMSGVIDKELVTSPYTQDFVDTPMSYSEMQTKLDEVRQALSKIPGAPSIPELPEMNLSLEIEPFVVKVPIEISLPSAIKSVKNIKLHENANVDLDIKVNNPLFTEGSIVPHLDIDLHNLFHIYDVTSGDLGDVEVNDPDGGSHLEQHVKDNFELNAENGWDADHVYYVDALALVSDDWEKQSEDSPLVLDKEIKVSISGKITNSAKTTLRHLYEHGSEPMSVEMTLKFNDFTIEDVEMEIEPIVITQEINMPIDVPAVKLPDVVEKVESISLENPLQIAMEAELPEAFKSLDLKLETLEVHFPDGLAVGTHDKYNEGKLTYKNVSLKEGLADEVNITGLNLPDPVGGNLSYNGAVKVTAKAVAEGVVNSKDLLDQSKAGDIKVAVDVAYAPVLADYNVKISDYNYDVEVDPIVINQSVPAEVGALKEVVVRLEGDPVITIDLDYPTAGDRLDIRPKDEGLKISFPEMLVFKNLNPSYNYNRADNNSITFTKDQTLPKKISLEIDYILIKPEPVAGKKDEYCIKGEMKVEGGVRLVGTTLTKDVLDELVAENAKISFGAHIPALKPASLAIDEYTLTLEEQEFALPIQDLEVPELIKSIPSLELNEVYLDMAIDASSVVETLGNVEMDLNVTIDLPKFIKVGELSGDNRTLTVSGSLNDKNQIVFDPVHIIGFDLSEIEFGNDKVSLGEQKVVIRGGAALRNVSVDLNKLDKDFEISMSGKLATKGTESIELGKISAVVDYKVDVNETIDITSILGEIGKQLEMIPDLHRFNAWLDLKTNLSLPVFANVRLTPYKNGEPGTSYDENIELKTSVSPSDTTYTRIFISNSKDDKPEDTEYQHIVIPVLDFVEDMPDSIQVSLQAGTIDNATFILEPSAEYVLAADYKIDLPLELGEDFLIEFSESVEAPDVVNQILAYGSVGLEGKVVNGLPIQLDLKFDLLDEDGNTIPLADGAGKTVIMPCNLDGSARVSDLKVILGVKKGVNTAPVKSIRLKFAASSGKMAGGAFRPESSLQVELKAVVPEGVTVNIKDLMGSNTSGDKQ